MTITIPADTDLDATMPDPYFADLMTWLNTNQINARNVSADRPTIITPDQIDCWEIVAIDQTGAPTETTGYPDLNNAGRRAAGYQLSEGQEWSTDDDHAVAIWHRVAPIVEPLPDDLRQALVAALERS